MRERTFESMTTLSQAEFADWLERRPRGDLHHYELLNGRVVTNPPAGYPHGEVEAAVVSLLRGFAVAGGLGKVLGSSQGYELPSGDTVEPDASFISNQRWCAAPAPAVDAFLKVAPDLVVEILSASTATRDRGEKKAIYERNQVREYWLLDPRSRELTLYRLQGDRFDAGTPRAEGERAQSVVLPGLDFLVRELFP